MTLVLAVSVLMGACSMENLSEAGAQIQLVEKPPQNCEYAGNFIGVGPSQDYAMNSLRNIAGKHGGTHLVAVGGVQIGDPIPVAGDSIEINGIAYKCGAGSAVGNSAQPDAGNAQSNQAQRKKTPNAQSGGQSKVTPQIVR